MKPRGPTAGRVWLWDLLSQNKEMGTKMLQRPTMILQTEWGKTPLLLTILEETNAFFP